MRLGEERVSEDARQATESLGEALASEGRLAEASGAFEQVVQLRPVLSRPALRHGHMLMSLGQWQEAVKAFETAATAAAASPVPDSVETQAMVLKGQVLDTLSRVDEAKIAYRRALSNLPLRADKEEIARMLGPLAQGQGMDMPVAMLLPGPEGCAADDVRCWDVPRRLRAARWSDENPCEDPGDVVLGERCSLFELRRWLLLARLLRAQELQTPENQGERYPWEVCFKASSIAERPPTLEELTVGQGTGTTPENILKSWGVVRWLPHAAQSIAAVMDVDDLVARILRKAAEGGPDSSQYVHMARHRHHMRLRPDGEVRKAVAFLADIMQHILPFGAGAPSGLVVEMGAFITNLGAKPQRWHEDFQHVGCRRCASPSACGSIASANASSNTEEPLPSICAACLKAVGSADFASPAMPVYSCQLLLTEELGHEKGGLEVLPGSHELGSSRSPSALRLGGPSGTVVCYDGTLQHRGAGHNAAKANGKLTSARVVVYLSSAGPGHALLPGTAMSPELLGLRLSELAGERIGLLSESGSSCKFPLSDGTLR